jgi:MarR family transcriptional regulator, organic hydroperoxide resistance regulator
MVQKRMNTDDEPRIIAALERATHAVALWIESSPRELGVSQAEAHVLAHLARHSGSTINDLHRGFGHKRSTLTGILDRLEGRGLIRRAAHPTSRRLVSVELTDAGRGLAERVRASLDELEAAVRGQVGGEAVEAFLGVLRAFEAVVEGGRG